MSPDATHRQELPVGAPFGSCFVWVGDLGGDGVRIEARDVTQVMSALLVGK